MTITNKEQPVNNELDSIERRKVIRKIAVGTAALVGCSILPDKWIPPLVQFGTVPAHAVTSNPLQPVLEEEVSPLQPAEEQPAPQPEKAESEQPEEDAPEAKKAQEPEGDKAPEPASNKFSLLFVQTNQPCASCGIWFTSATLAVVHSEGNFTSSQSGSLLIKKTTGKLGYFNADLSSIPASATIKSATLTMNLHTHEGIAGSDNRSVIAVYDYSSGSQGDFVRKITASGDIKGKGYSKSNPAVPLDFTSYAKAVHGG